MDTLLKELPKIEKNTDFSNCISQIDRLLEEVNQAKQLVAQHDQNESQNESQKKDSATISSILSKTSGNIKECEKTLADAEKTVYNGISKLGKTLDKTFKASEHEFDAENEPFLFPDNDEDDDFSEAHNNNKNKKKSSDHHVKMAVLMHLVHNGEFEVANTFIQENSIQESLSSLVHFYVLYQIIDAIDRKDLGPALSWVSEHRDELVQKRSDLPFYLHKLQFLKLLLEVKDSQKALEYAAANISGLGKRYLSEISRLMCSVLYVNNKDLSATPYYDVYFSPSYNDVKSHFKMEYCSLLDMSPESPLLLATMAGSMALPAVNRMRAVMKSRGAEWTSKDELPVEVDLPENLQFHSIFVCPVTKEETTEANPPMMLRCGHVISYNALNQLGKNHLSHVFKCPYCPQDGTLYEAKKVVFT